MISEKEDVAELVEQAPTYQPLSESELLALARIDFWVFIELAFPVLHPGKRLDFAPYLELLAQTMIRVSEGKWRRVVINLPPRHMKSMVVSIMYVAWRLGVDPTAKFITISYGDDLAHDHSALARKLMTSQLYRRIFPGTVLDKKAVDHIRTTKGGHRYATSIGSDITGFGADEIIIDDPIQPSDANSERAKEAVRQWVASSVMTRFNDPLKGALILVMHRLAPDDLSATLSKDADRILTLPLVAGAKEKRYALNGRKLYARSPGDVLNPSRMSAAEAEKLRMSLPRHVWEGQYQQQPTAGGSGMLRIDHFRRFDLGKPPKFELIIHSWDLGATINGNASVCTKWGLCRGKDGRDLLYLIGVVRVKMEVPEVRAAIKAEILKDKPALVIVDERGCGIGVYQDLRNEYHGLITSSTSTDEPIQLAGATQSRPSAGKIERFGRASLFIGDGQVLLPTEAPWLDSFLYEVAAFPNIADKDQVDSMAQVVGNFERVVQFARRNATQMK